MNQLVHIILYVLFSIQSLGQPVAYADAGSYLFSFKALKLKRVEPLPNGDDGLMITRRRHVFFIQKLEVRPVKFTDDSMVFVGVNRGTSQEFDIIYTDPVSPANNHNLWKIEVFKRRKDGSRKLRFFKPTDYRFVMYRYKLQTATTLARAADYYCKGLRLLDFRTGEYRKGPRLYPIPWTDEVKPEPVIGNIRHRPTRN